MAGSWPREWADDAEQHAEAGVPETVAFQTKTQLAPELLERAGAPDVPTRWVVGDTAYGSDGKRTEQPMTFPPYAPTGQAMAAMVAVHLRN